MSMNSDNLNKLYYNICMEKIFLKTSDGIKLALNHYKTGHNEVIIIVHGWFMTKDSKTFTSMSEEFSKYLICLYYNNFLYIVKWRTTQSKGNT